MPFLAPIVAFLAANAPAIGAASAIAGAGTTIGETIANSGGGSKPPVAPVTPPNAQQLLQQKQLVGQQSSNLEEATSGAAGPDFLKLFAPYLAGISGQPGANAAGQGAANQAWAPANSQPTNAAVNGQDVNLSSFLQNNT